MDLIVEYILAALLVIGGVFAIVGSFGLLKLPTTMQRLHAPTKATTIGVGSALIASMAYFWFYEDTVSWHELMITLFLFLTAPITANFIAKAQLHLAVKAEDLPPTGVGTQWATFDPEVEAVGPTLIHDREPD
ncbi:Na+/H+ antiporter subunit G [Pseudotabrizicola sediminis]|uniref:Na+/H+ antiporter subunit G n=1 Tax=Pseudotabrizicola sediminis TaxID=2486418 RepID=A0ABY2KNT3_9RHOB|nr:Na+/H+ antiporter subunit G [Pseudotabrizicola sediminis]TGD43668.1 Na+/H+ antiporter subunit G [Pseudotabrizicola sediminis]TGD66388.1 Na+/H+ antiporter subunit G [Tabrizicola sp. WMC-M-20]